MKTVKIKFLLIIILALAASLASRAETVTGVVRDMAGEPVAGVTVETRHDGKLTGTATDADGKFSIKAFKGDWLTFKCIGFRPQKIKLSGKARVDVSLAEAESVLDDVVVVGFATQKRSDITGAVAKVDKKIFDASPIANVAEALQGRVPGLVYNNSTGRLGTEGAIEIRGLNNLATGSTGYPLVLIDGVEGSLSNVNPQDIEEVSVLKDAASTSIYGVKAAFGVILVTTKKGGAGKVSVTYDFHENFVSPLRMPRMLDSETWALIVNDAYTNAGSPVYVTPEQMDRIRGYRDGSIKANTIVDPVSPSKWASAANLANDNVDWLKAVYRPVTYEMNHNLSVRGGTEKIDYYVSGSFLWQQGKMNYGKEDYKRYTLNGRFSAQATKWLRISYTTRFARVDNNAPVYGSSSLAAAYRKSPLQPLRDPNNFLMDKDVLAAQYGGQSQTLRSNYVQQLALHINPLKGWNINIDGFWRSGYTSSSAWQIEQFARNIDGTPDARTPSSYSSSGSNRGDNYDLNVTTDYSFDIKGHYLKILLGSQTGYSNNDYLNGSRIGIVAPELNLINNATGLNTDGETVAPSVNGGRGHSSTLGFFGRLSYNYQGRYLVEGTLRRDGTSRFKQGKRWGWFPSFSLGWNIAKEKFMEPYTPYVGMLKLRGSYGTLGNPSISDSPYESLRFSAQSGSWLIDGKPTNVTRYPQMVSSTLSWEKIRSINFGLDAAVLNNRLSCSFDYYIRDHRDIMGPQDELPAILGAATPRINNIDFRVRGYDVELSWRDNIGRDMSYGVGFNLTDYTAKITRYPNTNPHIGEHYENECVGEIWGYKTKGMAKTDEEMRRHLDSLPNGGQNAVSTQNWGAGDIMYEDLNGDGKIDRGDGTLANHGDLTVIGNNLARYNYGITLNFRWKWLSVDVLANGCFKHTVAGSTGTFWGIGGIGTSLFQGHEDYFRDDPEHPLGLNTDAYYPRPNIRGGNTQTQSGYLLDGSYLRLKTLRISCDLPSKWVARVGLDRFRIYFSAQNLFTITHLPKMLDPEAMGGNTATSASLGGTAGALVGDQGYYPLSKIYTVGVTVTL